MKYTVEKALDRLEELNSRYFRSKDTPEESEAEINKVLSHLTNEQKEEVIATLVQRWYFN